MDRKSEFLSLLKDGKQDELKARQLIDELVFLEKQMQDLKKYPFIAVNPKNPAQQKPTAASKQYKELLQQYNNSLRLLLRITGDIGETEEESPLRAWLKSRKDQS
ncbi:MAG: hypothetical protein J6S92_00325 [Oscillospiraceae bacterium]|nr:hypothetical protein [Bacteroidaceae bacterium]MBP0986721.1 hypothetical protein [Oscillospiraceae bacterium]